MKKLKISKIWIAFLVVVIVAMAAWALVNEERRVNSEEFSSKIFHK